MRIPRKPRLLSGLAAFRRIAQRGIPSIGRPIPTMPPHYGGYEIPGSFRVIDLVASQNFPPSPQP
jgi:hypothetical protein